MTEAPQPQHLMARVLPIIAAQHSEAWLVGGWVRDRLLGRVTHDIDFVTPTDAIATARQVADLVGGAFVLLDVERDTARVVVGPPGKGVLLDFAGLRGHTIEADLLARDFTVNAMAVAVAECLQPEPRVIDPAGGQRDLALRLLRAVSPDSFRQDPLRMLRGVRLSASLGFALDSETAAWARSDAELLDAVSRERVRDELAQTLALPQAERSLRQLDELRLLTQVVPELQALRTVEARPEAGESALNDALRAVGVAQALLNWLNGEPWELLPAAGTALHDHLGRYRALLLEYLLETLPGGRSKAILLLLAALLHNLGKGAAEQSRAAATGRLLGHDVLGASLAATVARRLCFSTAETVRLRLAIGNHLRPGQIAREMVGEPSRRSIYRFFRDAEPAGVEAILLSLASYLATSLPSLNTEQWQRRLVASAALFNACFERRQEVVEPAPLLDGHDVIEALDVAPGPGVGVLLEGIREAQAAGEVHSREEALALARRLLEREGLQ